MPLRDKLIDTALAQVGVREIGTNAGEKVESYLASCNLGQGYAWCACFVNWNYKQFNLVTPQSPAWSPSWFPTERIIATRGVFKEMPQKGDVIGIYFYNKQRIAHVGIFWKLENGWITTIEGNTNDYSSREGDGVYLKKRKVESVYQIAKWID